MPIVSVSLDDGTLKAADDAAKLGGYGNRSAVFRKGILAVASEAKRNAGLPGRANAVLIAMHEEDFEDEVTELTHEFDEVISMRTHSKLDDRHCLEVFVLKGSGKAIQKLADALYANKRVKYAKLVVP